MHEAKLQPHRNRYWLNANPDDPEAFAAQVKTVCKLYHQAPQLLSEGTHVVRQGQTARV